MSVRLLEPPAGVSVIETSGGRVWSTDGIVYEAIDVSRIELEHAQEFASAVRHLAGDDGPSLLLADMSLVRATTSEVRAYSASDETKTLVAAQGILVGSPVTRVVASFFVRVFQPPFPVRLFTTADDASAWLHGLHTPASA
ncbi:MAG: hypothetical protein R3B72_24340 [Polyangiaceae bacterium]